MGDLEVRQEESEGAGPEDRKEKSSRRGNTNAKALDPWLACCVWELQETGVTGAVSERRV